MAGHHTNRPPGNVVGRGYYRLWTVAVLLGRNIGLRVEKDDLRHVCAALFFSQARQLKFE
jgi:hypothetical protein